jgi:hypothetical protein
LFAAAEIGGVVEKDAAKQRPVAGLIDHRARSIADGLLILGK